MITWIVFSLASLAAVLLFGGGTGGFWPMSPRGGSASTVDGSARPSPDTQRGVSSVPLLLELLGTSLAAGLSVQGALRVVARVSGDDVRVDLTRVVAGLEIGASWENSWAGNLRHEQVLRIHDALSFGALTGASAAPLLHAEARRYRASTARAAEKKAAALGVKLVLPLGLCSLPAFIALGIVPVVLAMVPNF